VILYAENPEDSTKLLKLINKSSNVAGYKVNPQRSFAFLHTNSEQSKKEIKNTFSGLEEWLK
jgi:hypothetical protein